MFIVQPVTDFVGNGKPVLASFLVIKKTGQAPWLRSEQTESKKICLCNMMQLITWLPLSSVFSPSRFAPRERDRWLWER
jgi:hypothetical protein